MRTQPQLKLLVICLGVALAQWGTGSALADSAIGVDTALGNALNPPGRSAIPRPVADGGYDTVRRSPSGQLYGLPPAVNEETTTTEGGWEYKGGVDFGVLGGDGNTHSTKFREYKDLGNGLYLNYFEVEAEKPDTANFIQAFGGGLGMDDQFYGLQFGRYNDWKLRLFYNETPHVFSSSFKPIYTNNGSSTPTLDNGTPGGAGSTTAAALIAYSKTLPDTEVGLVRRKGGARFDKIITDNWKVYASFTQENREGERPFGFQDGAVEGVEPINYVTNDFLAGASYADKLTTVNLYASASLFKNQIDYLFNDKALVASAAAPTTFALQDFGSYTLAPDNQAFNLKGEYARKLPDFYKGRFSASVAWGTSRQDDPIRTPIRPDEPGYSSASIVQAAANGVAFNVNNWNGVNGTPTSRATSGLRIDTSLLNLALSLNPLDELNLKGTFRHYETQNKSGTYYAYNPLTGQWGYGIQEGAFNTVVVPSAVAGVCQAAPGFTIPASGCTPGAAFSTANPRSYSSPPRDYGQTNYTLSADYDLGHASSLEGVYERENFSHTYRERDETWEDKLKLTYVNRSLGNATLRMSYEDDRKRGSFYDPLVNTRSAVTDWMAFYGITYTRAALADLISKAGTGGIYPTLANLQAAVVAGGGQFNTGGWMKPDQSDRDQNIFNVRLNYMPREDMDIGAMVQMKQASYPGNAIGPQKDDLNSFNMDFNYQPSSGTQFTAFVSRQEGVQRTVENYGISPAGVAFTAATMQAYVGGICGATLTTSNVDCYMNNQRAMSSNVDAETKNTTNVIGLGLTHDFGKLKFGAYYTYAKGVTSIARSYGPTALTAANQTVEATYGTWPDMVTTQNALDLNLLVPVNKKTSVRFMYRYEKISVSDWHYDMLPTMTPVTLIPADYGPQNYATRVLGLFLHHTF